MLKTITEEYTGYVDEVVLGWDVYFDLGDDMMDYAGYVSASNFNGHDNLSDAVEEIANAVSNRVRAGAIALDKHMPGWESEIDVSSLNMGSFLSCIIGQLFGNNEEFHPWTDFSSAVKNLGSEDESGAEFGFNAKGDEYNTLGILWTEQIEWRLGKNND